MSLEVALKRKEALKALRQQIECGENNKSDDKKDEIDESRKEWVQHKLLKIIRDR